VLITARFVVVIIVDLFTMASGIELFFVHLESGLFSLASNAAPDTLIHALHQIPLAKLI
jgi:hypothetical protein